MSKSVKERTKRKVNLFIQKICYLEKLFTLYICRNNLNEILKEKLEEDLYNKCCKEGYKN